MIFSAIYSGYKSILPQQTVGVVLMESIYKAGLWADRYKWSYKRPI